jgi:predicted ATPase
MFLKRVRIENFRSIALCDVELSSLNFLIGPNGSGKTNFLYALQFVRDCLTNPVDQAFSFRRSNFPSLRHMPADGGARIVLEIDFALGGLGVGHYGFEIEPFSLRGWRIASEVCRIGEHSFRRERETIKEATFTNPPAASPFRLYLSNASGLEPFGKLYRELTSFEFYEPDPTKIRQDAGDSGSDLWLESDCANLALIFDRLSDESRSAVVSRLRAIVPELRDVTVLTLKDRRFLRFQHFAADFFANEMSDGTLRALAILVATSQPDVCSGQLPFMTFEEPETGIHPGALGVLLEAIEEASHLTQIIVTSQSSDLLNDRSIPLESLLAAEMVEGSTMIGPIDPGSRDALRNKLFTPGELMRTTRIRPERAVNQRT